MKPREFVAQLKKTIAARAQLLEPTEDEQVAHAIDVVRLLKVALRSEAEAFEVAARWVSDTRSLPIKLACARQCGDEAKHYQAIEQRLAQLGASLAGFDPVADGFSPITQFLLTLDDPAARLAAGFMAREAIGYVKNEQFLGALDRVGDHDTAQLYRSLIQPDEQHHRDHGAELLVALVDDMAARARAEQAALGVLDRAVAMQRTAAERLGIHHAPGC